MACRRQISACALFRSFPCDGCALAHHALHLFGRRCSQASVGMIAESVDNAREFDGRLPQQGRDASLFDCRVGFEMER